VTKYHPTVWHFFDCLKKEEVCVRQQMLKIMMGENKKINKKTASLQQRIHSLESRFKEKKSILMIFLKDYLYWSERKTDIILNNFSIFFSLLMDRYKFLK